MGTQTVISGITPCPSKKKSFKTEQEAVEFEERNRAHYGSVTQHAYLCDECDNYHLSSLLPGAYGHSTITTNYTAIENGKAPSGRKQRRCSTEEDVKQMRKLRARGLSTSEIAAQLDFSPATVFKHLATTDKQQPASLETISLKKKELEQQLRKLQEEEQRIIEAKLLKVVKLLDGQISIRKESQFIVLPPDNCIELCEKLEEILTSTQNEVHP